MPARYKPVQDAPGGLYHYMVTVICRFLGRLDWLGERSGVSVKEHMKYVEATEVVENLADTEGVEDTEHTESLDDIEVTEDTEGMEDVDDVKREGHR